MKRSCYADADQTPVWGRKTVVKLLTRDLLVGSPAGLELTEDMLRLLVTADRAEVFEEGGR